MLFLYENEMVYNLFKGDKLHNPNNSFYADIYGDRQRGVRSFYFFKKQQQCGKQGICSVCFGCCRLESVHIFNDHPHFSAPLGRIGFFFRCVNVDRFLVAA